MATVADSVRSPRVMLTGGGTGGHIYPALAMADLLREVWGDRVAISYAGQPDGMEASLVPRRSDLEFLPVRSAGMPRQVFGPWLRCIGRNGLGILDAARHLDHRQPDLVIATGGFVTFPVLVAARWRRVPYLLHEQNAVLGFTNRLFAGGADHLLLSYPLKASLASPATVVGNPVRAELRRFAAPDRAHATQEPPGAGRTRQVLVVGGSRGAASINRAVVGLAAWLKAHPDVNLVHVTGERDHRDIASQVIDARRHQVVPYLHNMGEALATADLLISRAGATILAEIAALGRPSILIPFPHATDNHQEHNARAMVAAGAAEMILDRELSAETLGRLLDRLLSDQGRLAAMGTAARRSRPEDVETRIRELLIARLSAHLGDLQPT